MRVRRPTRWLLILANVAGLAVIATSGGWDVLQIYTGVGLPERQGPPMQLVAHRGDLDRYPENTLEGIVAATALPVDGIEFDVVMSADGTWWVMHDPTLDRTTDGTGYVAQLSDDAIARARIDGGLGFDSGKHLDLTVPRLTGVLEQLARYRGIIYVDIQHAPTGSAADVARLLRGRSAAVLCRDRSDARAVKRIDPSIKTYLRREDGPADQWVDGWLVAAFFEANAGVLQSVDRPVIAAVEEWRPGNDEAPLIRRAWALGVDAFLTRQPNRAVEALSVLTTNRQ